MQAIWILYDNKVINVNAALIKIKTLKFGMDLGFFYELPGLVR